MKKSAVAIFFTVFFTLYGLINAHILFTGLSVLPPVSSLRAIYVVGFLLLASSFIVGRFLERRWISSVSTAFVWIGSFWLAAMLYFFLACALFDVLHVIAFVVPPFGQWMYSLGSPGGRAVAGGVVALVIVALVAGHINAFAPRVRTLRLTIDKPISGGRLSIAMASDLHLGTIVGPRRCEAIVATLNDLGADLILLPGDLVDEDLGPVIRGNLGEKLRGLRAPLGVFAVTGNHEYIGGVEPAVRYLRDHGITVLRDEVVELPCGVTLAGREDRSAGMGGVRRLELRTMLNGVDRARPLVLMDHQPFHLSEAVNAGVDLQLSGHTHHGQLWPLNAITNAVYELSWGYMKKGGTYFYVSCGVGTWGPPVRTGNRPEVVSIILESSQQSSPRR